MPSTFRPNLLLATLLLIFFALFFLGWQHYRYDVLATEELTAKRQLDLVQFLLQEMLQAQNYHRVTNFLQEWGESNPTINSLHLSTRNDFVLGDYHQEESVKHLLTLDTQFHYGYLGEAKLSLGYSLDAAQSRIRALAWLLIGFYSIVAWILVALTSVFARQQRQANLLRQREARLQQVIEQQTKTKQRLDWQAGFSQLIGQFSLRLLHLESAEVSNAITTALRDLGHYAELDCCQLFLLDENQETAVCRYNWHTERLTMQSFDWPSIHLDNYPLLVERLNQRQSLAIADVTKLPATECQLQQSLVKRSISSLLVLPLLTSDRLQGFLCLSTVDRHRQWSQATVDLLRLAADVINRTLERLQQEQALKLAHNRLLAILNSLEAAVYVADIKTYEILFINRYLERSVGDMRGQHCWQALQKKQSGPCDFCNNDRLLDANGHARGTLTWDFQNTRTKRWYHIQDKAIRWVDGRMVRLEVATDITERKRIEQALAESEQRFRQLFDQLPQIAVQGYNQQLEVIFWNQASTDVYGYSCDEALGRRLDELILPPKEQQALMTAYRQVLAKERQLPATEQWLQDHSGQLVPVLSSQVVLQNIQGQAELYRIDLDLRPTKAAEQELRLSAIAFEAHEGILITDQYLRIQRANQSWLQMSGYQDDDLIGHSLDVFQVEQQALAQEEKIWQQVQQQQHWKGEYLFQRKDGEIFTAGLSITAVLDQDGSQSHYVFHIQDITDRKRNEQRIALLAYHDSLTGLPNRTLLLDRLQQEIFRAERYETIGAVLFFDLDRFKAINDSLGHPVGDQLLCQVGQRLRENARQADTIARLGGDEFVVVLPELGKSLQQAHENAHKLAEKLRHQLSQPYLLDTLQLHTSPSVGVTLFPENANSVAELLKQADQAMYKAKEAGRNQVRFYQPAMQQQANQRLALETALRQAIAEEQLEILYHPLWQLETETEVSANKKLIGVEASLQWQHPQHGLLLPKQFIPLAEDSGIILTIGEWMLREICYQLWIWQNAGLAPIPLAINLADWQLRQSGFSFLLEMILTTIHLKPELLELEISEQVFISKDPETIALLEDFKRIGVRLVVDGFSTNYAHLDRLQQFAVDRLKLDQTCVQRLAEQGDDATLCLAILDLTEQLNIEVVFQGVESTAQFDFIRQKGFNQVKGVYLGQWLSCDQFEVLLSQATNQTDIH